MEVNAKVVNEKDGFAGVGNAGEDFVNSNEKKYTTKRGALWDPVGLNVFSVHFKFKPAKFIVFYSGNMSRGEQFYLLLHVHIFRDNSIREKRSVNSLESTNF